MKIYHIAALSENHIIAKDGGIPWDIRDDLRRFSEITKGHSIIMGMKTFASLGKKPLPGRRNVVLSRSDEIFFDGRPLSYGMEEGGREIYQLAIKVQTEKAEVCFCRRIEDALKVCSDHNEVYIIGGGTIYEQTYDLAHELRLTIVHEELEEDASCIYYPEIDDDEWMLSFVDARETHSYIDYVRRQG
jgi:dihydrofolate reductase